MKRRDVRLMALQKKKGPFGVALYWIQEREKIRLAKERGDPPPWTDDSILQQYRFCNVRRMDDKVSNWLFENWYKPNFDHPHMIIAAMLARHFNNIDTLEEIGFPFTWNPKELYARLMKRWEKGDNLFSGAYIVRGNNGKNKTDSVLNYTIQPMIDSGLNLETLNTSTMQQCHAQLMALKNIGSFMAGQIAADLRWAVSGQFQDKMSWAAIGPGSHRGMNRILGRPLTQPLPQEEFTAALTSYRVRILNNCPEAIINRLEAIDYQNTLCEFDKYMRTLFLEGRPKQNYPGK